MSPATGHVLDAALDVPLPDRLEVGAGTALFVAGTCFCPTSAVVRLELLVDGAPTPTSAHGMPRLDFSLERPDEPRAYRSGFWGIAPVPAREPGPLRIGLRADLGDGSRAEAELARLSCIAPATAPLPDPEPTSGADLVAICMATFNPSEALFARQIESIRQQTHPHWVCVISDDRSGPEGLAVIERVTAGDSRFTVSVAPRRLGFFGNFERALALAPPAARFVALADQDDRWYPEKLATLLTAIGDAQLAFSDARIVTEDGAVVSDTYWSTRRPNHTDLLSLLVANAVTGAASLLRRELLGDALPFPPAQFAHFHDHWLALTALTRGEIAFVDRPLYDYVQHGDASLGHAAANQLKGLRQRIVDQRDPRERVRMWRLHYFVDVARLMQLTAILRLRLGGRMTRRRSRALARFEAADRSLPAAFALALRGLRDLVGTPETLGAEWMLAHAFVWRRLLAATARERPQARLRLDAVPPPSLALRPARVRDPGPADAVADKLAPLDLAVSDTAPRRVNLLIPTVDLTHFFGGYIGKFNLARRLADRGVRVRLVTVDPVGPLPRDWRRRIEAYSGLTGLFERVEVAFGRGPTPLEVSEDDTFIATTWWTAHIAAAAMSVVEARRFVYLIQEYEPFTFPMGTWAALAAESYALPHFAVFSTELLRDYFRRHRIGVFSAGPRTGDRASLAFQNAITDVRPSAREELATRGTRRLLFYARPEPHAARNMFELGLLALGRAIRTGAFGPGWAFRGIGSVRGPRRLSLGGGVTLELLPRSAQASYAELLRDHDVGLALMYTPHPSLVPIEMAAAGLLTVTNTFENKTAERMAAISGNLIAAPPTVDGIATALGEAAGAVDDLDRRVSGSAVAWSRSWEASFDDALLDAIVAALGVGAAR